MKSMCSKYQTQQVVSLVLLLLVMLTFAIFGALPAAASDPRDPVIEQQMGLITRLSQLRALGGNYQRFADKVEAAISAKITKYGTQYDYWKWDGEAGCYSLAVASGNSYYIDTARAIGNNYITYVLASNGQIPEPNWRPETLACQAALGDANALKALGLLADEACRRFYRLTVYNAEADELSGRLLTWYILTPALASKLGAPAGINPYNGLRWNHADISGSAYRYALGRQNADGTVNLGNSGNFQTGMVMDALLKWRRLFAPDDMRPVVFARRSLEWLFANAFDGTGFRYSASDASTSADDNGFYASGAAAVAESGDARGKTWFEALLAGSVDHAWWDGAFQSDIQLKFLNAFAHLFGSAPINVSVNPASGTQAAGACYSITSTYACPSGNARIARVYMMISDQSYSNLFETMYGVQSNQLYAVGASGAWEGGASPGTAANISVENGALYCGGVVVTRPDAQTLQVRWQVSSPAKFAGQTLRISLFVETDDKAAGWDALGSVAIVCP